MLPRIEFDAAIAGLAQLRGRRAATLRNPGADIGEAGR